MKKYFALVVIPVIVAVVLGGCAAAGAGGGGGSSAASDPLANIPAVNFAGFDTVAPTSLSTQGVNVSENPSAADFYNSVNDLDNSLVVILTNSVADAIEAHVAAGGDPEHTFTFENFIYRDSGAVHKQFFTIRLEDDTNGYVFRGFNDQVYFSADTPNTPQAESSWADARVELAFGPGFDYARFVLQLLDSEGVPLHEEGVEYVYETQSGTLLGHWVYDTDGSGNRLYNTSYQSLDNDGSITYRGFQDDSTPTIVMEQTSEGIGCLLDPKDSATLYDLLNHDGTDAGTDPSPALKDDLDFIAGTLDATFAQQKVDDFLASADLDAASYSELLPTHQAYTPSWE